MKDWFIVWLIYSFCVQASYRANEITTIVNGSMLMTPKAFESHASLINLGAELNFIIVLCFDSSVEKGS